MPPFAHQVAPELSPAHTRPLIHIRELDGVRGIAAIMVFFHHLCYTSIDPAGWGPFIRILRTISIGGSTGIDIFFVLSGFLITSLLIAARKSPAYYRDFYWKRALRILPLYILCLLGVLTMIPGAATYVFLSAIFLANFAPLFHIINVGPFWTLAIEEQFYLAWPTVVRRRSVEQIQHWTLVIGLSAVLLRLIAAPTGHHNYYFTFFRCDGLAFGAFLACWFYRRPTASSNLGHESLRILVGIAFGIALILPSLLLQPRLIAFQNALTQTGITLLCGSTIAWIIRNKNRAHLAPLRSPVLTFFGLISYAMYMTHLYVMRSYDALHGPLQPGDNLAYASRLFAVLSVTIALCLLTRYLIELPAISLRRFVLSSPTQPNASDPPLPLSNM
jgi:peptidoglycan/LPS O-acetylase OafA/YrhL